MVRKIDLLDYIPKSIKSEKSNREFKLEIHSDELYVLLSYYNPVWNSKNRINREYSLTIPRYINRNSETFEVLGLLQAEMGKTQNGTLNFCNCEYKIINKVMKWFDKELEFGPQKWKWQIKVNLVVPVDENIKKEVEERVILHWMRKTKISVENRYPKQVVYLKETKNSTLKNGNYGTLIIEKKCNLFSQIIKDFVKNVTNNIINFQEEEIRAYLKGIIAGEGCIEKSKRMGKYRVSVSAMKKEERDIYQRCFEKLGIESKQYQDSDKVLVSKRKNNIRLLKQKLMCLSPNKYSRFLEMMKCYPNINTETGYFSGKRNPHNKISKDRLSKIILLSKENPSWNCRKIAGEVGVSPITVARVKKENNIGKRLNKTPNEVVEKIVGLHISNPSLYAYEIANLVGVHREVVEKIRRKKGLKRIKKSYR